VNISINIEAPQLANAILALAAALSGKQFQSVVSQNGSEVVQPVQQAPVQPDNVVQFQQQPIPSSVPTAPVPQQPPAAPVQQQAVPTSAPTYTMDQLAVAATQLMDAGRQPELLNLLQSFGVPSLMALPKEQYGNFATQLRGMGANL
jgi:hypothetical protein